MELMHWFILITAYFAFQKDEQSKWNVCVLSFPVNKRLLVRSRYLFLTFIFLVGSLVGLFLFGLSIGFSIQLCIEYFILTSPTFFMLSVFLPAAYRMGASGSIWILIVSYILLYLITAFFIQHEQILLFLNTLLFHHGPVFILLLALLLFWGSYFLSCNILETSDVQ
jgi:hypothetical protein